MKNVHTMKRLYAPEGGIMFFSSKKKSIEAAESLLSLLDEEAEVSHLPVGPYITYVSILKNGVSHDIIVEQHLVH